MLYGFLSRGHQQRVAADQPSIANRSVRTYDGRESYGALDTRLLGERRVNRHRSANQLGGLNVAADPDPLHLCFFSTLTGGGGGAAVGQTL